MLHANTAKIRGRVVVDTTSNKREPGEVMGGVLMRPGKEYDFTFVL